MAIYCSSRQRRRRAKRRSLGYLPPIGLSKHWILRFEQHKFRYDQWKALLKKHVAWKDHEQDKLRLAYEQLTAQKDKEWANMLRVETRILQGPST